MARVFAVMVQILLSSGAVAVQIGLEPRTYHRVQTWLGALAQCRGTKLIEARKLSRYTEFLLRADASIRVQNLYKFILGAGAKQKP